ncbi:MAG: HlyD family type I secretion periplasmic adaptor subunit [Helicobacteraceae bacterium]|jgi:adhesin transport system membrane fusion protein|nr:HlyD family type I secretion periplasmic adaptor subunit [Helicobacteraceae bacterium]
MARHSQDDLNYMASLSSAVLQKNSLASRLIIWMIFLSMVWLIVWAYFAEIDELARGTGRVIPSKQVQVIQNLEGGIVSEILVDEGEIVEKGQVLLKIDDTSFSSSYEENHIRLLELQTQAIRLSAEASTDGSDSMSAVSDEMKPFMEHERALYQLNRKQLQQKRNILQEQINQRRQELREADAKHEQLKEEYTLIMQEVQITKPLVAKGIVSQVEFLQLSRQASGIHGEMESVELSSPRMRYTIKESHIKRAEAELEFRHKAKEELNKVQAEIARITESSGALEDRVKRALVRSPVKGIVQRLLVNTINGVIQPGMDIVEIIPFQDKLLIETKIKPSDIAYLYSGQKSMVKFTAYDFSIYGSLEGKVTHISADTITDEEGESFYLVHIKTDRSFLEFEGKKYDILVGMIANVDIITGKKSVLDFLLKPILKVRQAALRER